MESLAYLSEQGLEYSSLTYSNILVSKEGLVRIGLLELLASDILLTLLDGRLRAFQ
jgi:hypothetical protein